VIARDMGCYHLELS